MDADPPPLSPPLESAGNSTARDVTRDAESAWASVALGFDQPHLGKGRAIDVSNLTTSARFRERQAANYRPTALRCSGVMLGPVAAYDGPMSKKTRTPWA